MSVFRSVLCLGIAAGLSTCAQQLFEVASIKPANPETRGYSLVSTPGGKVVGANMSLKLLIAEAYHVPDFLVFGGPSWIESEKFDLNASAGRETKPGELRVMLQALLADRFALKIRHEQKELPVYVMTKAKKGDAWGPELHSADAGDCANKKSCGGLSVSNRSRIFGQKAPIEQLPEMLRWIMGRPVIDETGLKGLFDIDLNWTPDQSQARSSDAPKETDGPSIFTAMQEQLGIRLESRKRSIDVLIAEHAEKPSAN